MKHMRRTAGYTGTDYKTNTQIAKELKITPIWDKLLEYKRNWIQHVNRMPRIRLPTVMKHYSPTGRRNHGRPLNRLMDTWDRNGSTSGPTPWQIYDDDDDDDDYDDEMTIHIKLLSDSHGTDYVHKYITVLVHSTWYIVHRRNLETSVKLLCP